MSANINTEPEPAFKAPTDRTLILLVALLAITIAGWASAILATFTVQNGSWGGRALVVAVAASILAALTLMHRSLVRHQVHNMTVMLAMAKEQTEKTVRAALADGTEALAHTYAEIKRLRANQERIADVLTALGGDLDTKLAPIVTQVQAGAEREAEILDRVESLAGRVAQLADMHTANHVELAGIRNRIDGLVGDLAAVVAEVQAASVRHLRDLKASHDVIRDGLATSAARILEVRGELDERLNDIAASLDTARTEATAGRAEIAAVTDAVAKFAGEAATQEQHSAALAEQVHRAAVEQAQRAAAVEETIEQLASTAVTEIAALRSEFSRRDAQRAQQIQDLDTRLASLGDTISSTGAGIRDALQTQIHEVAQAVAEDVAERLSTVEQRNAETDARLDAVRESVAGLSDQVKRDFDEAVPPLVRAEIEAAVQAWAQTAAIVEAERGAQLDQFREQLSTTEKKLAETAALIEMSQRIADGPEGSRVVGINGHRRSGN